MLKEALKPMQETWKVVVGFAQVVGSFFGSFPDFPWPSVFHRIGSAFDVFNFDFLKVVPRAEALHVLRALRALHSSR